MKTNILKLTLLIITVAVCSTSKSYDSALKELDCEGIDRPICDSLYPGWSASGHYMPVITVTAIQDSNTNFTGFQSYSSAGGGGVGTNDGGSQFNLNNYCPHQTNNPVLIANGKKFNKS